MYEMNITDKEKRINELKEELNELEAELEYIKEEINRLEGGEYTEEEIKEFEEAINEIFGIFKIDYLEFTASEILKNLDLIAYNEYLDAHFEDKLTELYDQKEDLEGQINDIENEINELEE